MNRSHFNRLEGIARAPVYTQFGDTLAGREVIKAFGASARFERENSRLVSRMACAKYSNEACCKWAQSLTTLLGCCFYLFCGIVCSILQEKDNITSAQLGLILLYSATLQRAVMDFMMGLTQVETQFVSVERVAEYTRLPQEVREGSQPPLGWPASGGLVLSRVELRYQINRPLVLRGASLSVPPGAKVALVGRTGCGKSSLLSCITRLYPLSGGSISIDGVDIHSLDLKQLRLGVRVVSQDATLFSASVRDNMIGQHSSSGDLPSDAEIWEVLEKVGMASKIATLPGGLSALVTSSGEPFSVGERQLLTTARVILPRAGKQCKLILADEPTASVDLNSDDQIHRVLLGLPCTMLMVCHRLQHVRHFDLVATLADGRVVEFGPPNELLLDESSFFSKMYARAGHLKR